MAATSTTNLEIGTDDDMCLAMQRIPKTGSTTRYDILEPWVDSMSKTLPHIPTYSRVGNFQSNELKLFIFSQMTQWSPPYWSVLLVFFTAII